MTHTICAAVDCAAVDGMQQLQNITRHCVPADLVVGGVGIAAGVAGAGACRVLWLADEMWLTRTQ